MEIKIEGNPGIGNTYQEIHIGNVENYNPNATTVTNNYYGTREESHSSAFRPHPSDDVIDTTNIRTEILNYVSCLRPSVADNWKSRYMKLWEGILDLEMVAEKVYNPGKQAGTNFNRNLVANIIRCLGNQKNEEDCIYKDYNAAQFAEMLEGSKNHSVRAALGHDPDDRIESRINSYLETFKL